MAVVTSDLPEFSSARTQTQTPAKRPLDPTCPKSTGSASGTPRVSRLEVVLNVSPVKTQQGHQLWSEADLDDIEDELGAAPPPPATQGPKKRGRRPGPRPAAVTATSPAPATTKRPRGRPKGWRPGMPSTKTGRPTASAHRYLDQDGNPIPRASATPSAVKSTGDGPKRRGRPPRPPSPTPRGVWETMEPPRYVPFLCEWAGCRAELQNIDTLRRHLGKVHGVGAGALVCQWGHCARRGEEQDEVRFGDYYEVLAHVDERHLVPFAWHVGDGHRNEQRLAKKPVAAEEDVVPKYLLGPTGMQVTPWVKEQKVEDLVTWRENRRRLRAILLQRDANAPLEEDPEEHGEHGEGRDALGAA